MQIEKPNGSWAYFAAAGGLAALIAFKAEQHIGKTMLMGGSATIALPFAARSECGKDYKILTITSLTLFSSVLLGWGARDVVVKLKDMKEAISQRKLWSGVAAIRRFSLAVGITLPMGVAGLKMGRGLWRGEREACDQQSYIGSWHFESLVRPFTPDPLRVMQFGHQEYLDNLGAMSSSQIEGLILTKTVPIGQVSSRLGELGRTQIIDDLLARGVAACEALPTQRQLNTLQHDLLGPINEWQRAYGLRRNLVQVFDDLPEVFAQTEVGAETFSLWQRDHLAEVLRRIENDRESVIDEGPVPALDALFPLIRMAEYDIWCQALGIPDIGGLEGVLMAKGLQTDADLRAAGILAEDNSAVAVASRLAAYQPPAANLEANYIEYLRGAGSQSIKALKVAGGLFYGALWLTLTAYSIKRHPYLAALGAGVGVAERLFFGHEVDGRGRIDCDDVPGGLCIEASGATSALSAGLTLERVQADWLDGRDLVHRARSFGERGFIQQNRVVASEMGVNLLYNFLDNIGLFRGNIPFPIGGFICGRALTHTVWSTVEARIA